MPCGWVAAAKAGIIDNDAGGPWRRLWRKSPGRNVDP
jgi:hypothetical protein